MTQLFCRDLKPGDVLLKMASPSTSHKIIKLGQRLAGQPNAFLAHAAIALDTQFCIEAQKVGVTANHLAMKNRDCGYYVYRCTNPMLGRGAATCAKMFFDIAQSATPTGDIAKSGTMKYDTLGAAKSLLGPAGNAKTAAEMDALLDALLKGRRHDFFCSQFVVYVYQLAAYQSGLQAKTLFNVSDAKVTPSVLASLLQNNPSFIDAGYMMPGER